jgi:polysaccharide biosynthesis/export protein
MRELAYRAIAPAAIALCLAAPPITVRAEVETAPAVQAEDSSVPYRLYPSDTINIRFALTPELDDTVTLPPDGVVALPGAREVRLAGLTATEASLAVRAAYAGVLRDPIITVDLKDFNKPFFVVIGSVGCPGKYDLRGPTSAMEAIAVAGGFTETAKHSQVLLFRRVSGAGYEATPLDLKRVMRGHDLTEDPLIRAGDMLVVPQNTISKIKRFIPSSGVGAYYQP